MKEQNLMEESDLFEMIREIVSSDNSFAIADSFLKKIIKENQYLKYLWAFWKAFEYEESNQKLTQ